MAFDPQKELKIDATPDAQGTFRLVTKGLAKHGRRELELIGLPQELAMAGAVVLNNVAGYVVDRRPITHLQTFGLALQDVLLVGRGLEVDGLLRLVDIMDDGQTEKPARMLVTTAQLMRGLAVVEENADEAVSRWMCCVDFFPGDPANAEYRFKSGQVTNQENHLVYLALAQHDYEGAGEWYRRALERSNLALAYELGAEELLPIDRATVVRAARELVEALLAPDPAWGSAKMSQTDRRGADLMAMVLSPIVHAGNEGYFRFVNPAPFVFRNYFYEAPVRQQLQAAAVHELAADLYEAMRKRPARVLELTRETRNIYVLPLEPLEPHGHAPVGGTVAAAISDVPHVGLQALSRLLAQIGRLLAAGLTHDEIRALHELGGDASSAQSKLDALEEREGQLFMAAMDVG
jgi:hypothetical protein